MKVDFDKFPAMKNLTADVRQKAVEFAESLGARGPRPTTVLGTAVTLAREWKSGRLPARPISAPFLVQPRGGRWIIKRSTDEKASHTFMRMDDAVRRAQQLAQEVGAACFVFGPGGTLIQRFEARVIAEMQLPREPVVESFAMDVAEARVIAEMTPVSAPVESVATEVAEVRMTAEMTPVSAVEGAVDAPVMEAPPVIAEVVAALAVAEVDRPVVAEVQALVADGPGETSEASPEDAIASAPGDSCSDEAASSEPIRVKKVGAKWAVMVDGRAEILPSRAKAIRRAFELGHALSRPVST